MNENIITFTVITMFTVLSFAIYIELSPSMGNIWYRYDSDNVKRIQLIGLINLMAAPLTNQYMWRIEMWDINIFIWLIIALGTMYCISTLYCITHIVLHHA